MKPTIASPNWITATAKFIGHLHQPDFPAAFFQNLNTLVTFDLALAISFHREFGPAHIFDNFETEHAKQSINFYLDATYVLDPLYRAFQENIEEGLYTMEELAPDAYFINEHQDEENVIVSPAEEIGYRTRDWPSQLNEVGFFIRVSDRQMIVLSLFRKCDRARFSRQEKDDLQSLTPIIASAFKQYHRLCLQNADSSSGGAAVSVEKTARVNQAFEDFGKPTVTSRESQVLQMVLRGHSSESIGLNLNISTTTAKTHRRNAYAKLNISSQSELLALFIDSLKD